MNTIERNNIDFSYMPRYNFVRGIPVTEGDRIYASLRIYLKPVQKSRRKKWARIKLQKKELTEVGNVIIKYFPNQLDLKGESIYGKIYPPCFNRKRR